MLPRRRVKIVRPENIPPFETEARAEAYAATFTAGMRESTLQDMCEDIARRYGWTVYHETNSRKSSKRMPDLIMLSPVQQDGSVVLVMLELKTEKGTLTEDQEIWQMKLGLVNCMVTGVMRPAGWQQFVTLCSDPLGATSVDKEYQP